MEKDIISHINKNIKVSVYCTAFNHEKYIRDTLEGFVTQKTTFNFEVFVHDDASTDSTKLIIQEYAEKYPQIIYPIYQEENQYSKGIGIVKTHIFPKMRGEYVAICEGDDYWCDKYKLQKQVDFLDNNLEYSACVHNTRVLDLGKNRTRRLNQSEKEYDLDIKHVLLDGGVDYHTSSLVYRIEHAKVIYSDNSPEFYTKPKKVEDYPLAIYLTLNGKVRYIPDEMSVYRLGTPGSWTKSIEDLKKYREMHFSIIEMLKSVDEYSNCRYHSLIERIIDNRLMLILKKETDISILMKKDMRDFWKRQDLIDKIKIFVKVLYVNKVRQKRLTMGDS